jgi:hypothetical protein
MAPQAQPIVTVSEIDEALWWVVLTAPRDKHYDRIIDALLDQRNRIADPPPPPPPPSPDYGRQGDHPTQRARS